MEELTVDVAGATETLTCDVRTHLCGHIKDGVAFEFEGRGWWVVALDELKRIVRSAEEARREERETP